MQTLQTSRREFLKASVAGALVVGFTLPMSGRVQAAGVFQPNAFVRITPDNRVTIVVGAAEMGQGVLTALPMLLAEELDVDWRSVRSEHAPVDPAFNNPAMGMQMTGGSTSVRSNWEPLRKAGAAARAMLVAAAAKQWQVDAATLTTANGKVLGPNGKQASYGSLVEAAAKQPVPANPKLKERANFKLLGKPLRRLDTPAKVNGTAQYGIDAQVDGMLIAVMARAPLPGAKIASVDDTKAKAVKGVQRVIRIDNGVAVLANGYWAAKKGRDALDVRWDLGANAQLSSDKISAMLTEGASRADKVARNEGNVDTAGKPAKTIKAQYEAPYLAHACMEPLNCTAWVKSDGVEIWAGTQTQGPLQGAIAQAAGVPPAKVKINTLMLGGGFGRRFATDFTVDAVLLSKLSGKPVKLIYSREDDMAAGYYRPAAVTQFEAGLDAQNRPVLLKVNTSTPSIAVASGFMQLPANGVDAMALEGVVDMPYDIPNQRVLYGRREPGPKVWFWRSVGNSQNAFFAESFIDELAAAAKRDPYEYRRALLAKQPRHLGVLDVAAQRAGWGKPMQQGMHRGIAVVHSFGTYVAEVAEVSVGDDGMPKVHRVVAAVDCGQTVNPSIIRQQITGAIVYGLSAALYGKISFKDGRVEQGNFHQYQLLRMNEMPKVEVFIVRSNEAPGGIGEPGTPPIAPAVANALFAATGKRIRSLPIDPAILRKA